MGLIPPLMIVIGVPNCIYLVNKYHAEYKKHGNKTKALKRVVMKVGNATLLTKAMWCLRDMFPVRNEHFDMSITTKLENEVLFHWDAFASVFVWLHCISFLLKLFYSFGNKHD